MARSTTGKFAHLTALAAALLASVAVLGCGSSGSETSTSPEDGNDTAFAPNVVTDDDIATQEEGTPGRGLLEWWQAFQFQDVPTVESLTSPEIREDVGDKKLAEVVELRGRGLQGIEVLSVSENGDSASVRAGLLTFVPEKEGDPPPSEPTGSTPATFTMAKDGEQWLFDSPEFLQPLIDSVEAAEENADGGGSEGG